MSDATNVENQVTDTIVEKVDSVANKIQDEASKISSDEELSLLQNKVQQFDKLQVKMDAMDSQIQNLEHDLQVRTEEKENYKNKIHHLETELKNQQLSSLNPAQQNEVEKIKKNSEEMLVKAKGVIFDKTKLCKNQELKIEALIQQVGSLKEVLSITKDLLEIRNLEVKHLEERMTAMETKINTERYKHELLNKKLDAMAELNASLKAEYETQLRLFNELRVQYAERDRLAKGEQL